MFTTMRSSLTYRGFVNCWLPELSRERPFKTGLEGRIKLRYSSVSVCVCGPAKPACIPPFELLHVELGGEYHLFAQKRLCLQTRTYFVRENVTFQNVN